MQHHMNKSASFFLKKKLKGYSGPETSAVYMKDLSEPTLKRPFVRRNNFYLPRYLTLLIDFVTYYSRHVCSNWGGSASLFSVL